MHAIMQICAETAKKIWPVALVMPVYTLTITVFKLIMQ